MLVFDSAEQLRAQTGKHLGYSTWYRIDQRRIDQFAVVTGDHQWIHVDQRRAQDGPFGTTIAHGLLTLSILPVLAKEIWRVEGTTLSVNYGYNKIRFPAPVPVESSIRAAAAIVEVADVGEDGIQVTTLLTAERADSTKPCCAAETLTRYYF